MKLSAIVVCASFVAAAAYAGGGGERDGEPVFREVQQTIDASADGWIDIRSASGSITVRGWDRDLVEVSGTVGEDVVEVQVGEDPGSGDVRVRVILREEDNYTDLNIEAVLSIRVPAGRNVYVSGLATSVNVEGIPGDVEVRTATGDIRVAGPLRSVAAETLAGEISISGPVEAVEFGSATGGVTVRGLQRVAYGSTLDGEIRIEDSQLEDAVVSTLTGRIFLGGDLAPDARVQAVARFGGSVEMVLPRSVQGLFTLNGGSADTIDMTRFAPSQPVEWVFGNPVDSGPEGRSARTALPGRLTGPSALSPSGDSGRIALSIDRSGSVDLHTEADVRTGMDIVIDLPRLVNLGTVAREFRVGTSNTRVILEVSAMVGTRNTDSDGPKIIIRTAQ